MAELASLSQNLELLNLKDVPFGREMRGKFLLDPNWTALNHGSFGTYPTVVRSTYLDFQLQSERRPCRFFISDYIKHLDTSRAALAKYLNVPVDTIAFVMNATTGVNSVLRSLKSTPGDKILYFDFVYGACKKTIDYISETTPLEGVRIDILLPCHEDEIVDALRNAIIANGGGVLNQQHERKEGESRVRIALFDTIVSMPGVRLPFEKLVQVCRELGVLSLVDGAHGIGHIPIDLGAIDPDFFVSNCHKWLYNPRGCAVFHVPIRNQHLVTTLPTSHDFIPNVGTPFPTEFSKSKKSPWVKMFEFVGTHDFSPYLCVPSALAFRDSIGEEKIYEYIKRIVKRGAEIIATALGTEYLDNHQGTLTDCALINIRLPIGVNVSGRHVTATEEKSGVVPFLVPEEKALGLVTYLRETFIEEFETFMAVMVYRGNFYVRISGQIYLEEADYVYGAEVLKGLVERVKAGKAV